MGISICPGRRRPIQEVFDALLHVGPPSGITYARVSRELCADAAYVRMRRERMAMAPGGGLGDALCAAFRNGRSDSMCQRVLMSCLVFPRVPAGSLAQSSPPLRTCGSNPEAL